MLVSTQVKVIFMQDGMVTLFGHLNIASQYSEGEDLLAYYILQLFTGKELMHSSEIEKFFYNEQMEELYHRRGFIGPFTTIDEIKAFTQQVMENKGIEWAKIVSTDQYNEYLIEQNSVEAFKDGIGEVGYLLQNSENRGKKRGIFSIFR